MLEILSVPLESRGTSCHLQHTFMRVRHITNRISQQGQALL